MGQAKIVEVGGVFAGDDQGQAEAPEHTTGSPNLPGANVSCTAAPGTPPLSVPPENVDPTNCNPNAFIDPGRFGLRVAPSQIGPVAGSGLFVDADVPEGAVLCAYTGICYPTHDAMRLEDHSYLMRLGAQKYVDARTRLDVAARYINDCRHPLLYNVTFDKRPQEDQALVVALQNIRAGEELFVDYG